MASLGNDLALIRKSRDLSLDEIHTSTKIPKKVLASIEDDSIFKTSGSNKTYIRGYVRSYAQALSIEERDIVFALNKMEKNNYSGSLIDEKRRPGLEESKNKSKDGGRDDAGAEKDDTEVPDDDPTADNFLSSPDDINSVDWVDMGNRFQPAKTITSNRKTTVPIILALLVAAAFLAYWFYFRTTNNTTAEQTSQQERPPQTTSAIDTLQESTIPLVNGDSAGISSSADPNNALDDTLSIVLYAAYNKLEPVRVYTDIAGELNPYWIEQGEAIEFKFVNTFRFRGGLNRIVLLMNGHQIPNFTERFYSDSTRRVEINRSFFKEDAKWLQPPPDTLALDAPPPTVIHQLEP